MTAKLLSVKKKNDRNFITVECLLAFDKDEDREKVLNLMRKFSSMVRFAYKRLLEGVERKELKKLLSQKYGINTRYSDDAILLAQQILDSCLQRGQNPKKLVFGSRELFEKLKKKHLTGERRKKLRQKWEERRYGILYSRGDKSKEGNLNLRLVNLDNQWHLRINLGNGEYVWAKVVRSAKREKDRWINLVWDLTQAERTGNWFAYTVRLKLKNGKIYAQISKEEKFPEITITKENGVIGIDINAYPFHLALAWTSRDGNLEKYERISLNGLLDGNTDKREYLSWQIAHQVVEIAKREGKAIVVENLEKIPKGRRGDGMPKLRQKLQKWIYKGLLEKIEVVCKRNGVQVIKVNPAYTSVIGRLKYSPIYRIDKDVAGAYVIARRGLGFKESLPKNYRKLLEDKEFLSYSVARVEDRIAKLKKEIEKEKNEYERNKLKGRLKRLRKELKLLLRYLWDSGKSEPATQQAVNRERKPMRGRARSLQKSWRVLSVALAFSCLEWCPDHSPLKRVLISGDKVAGGVSPSLPGQGTVAQNRCSFIHLG
ncbi:IS200/IS605 family accessory protein TnpB-related protein [Thermocrinis sp.]|jgi:IS605 OrfB family transposase|uniref:IS200/IS605 family accessory protein TnpB-related protein n=1 Tax=Thermocrinis sp. TaxID=2024383 RepID=UPI003C08D976